MKSLLLLSLPVLFVLAGCSSIRSKQLVGREPVDLSQSIGEIPLSSIAGEWVDSDGEVTSITVTNAKEGEILYASADEDDDPITLTLRTSGHDVFVNLPPDEKGERMWMLMKVQGEMTEILAWRPDTALFRDLIAKGKIKGTNDPETRTDENGEEIKNRNPGAVIDDPTGEWVEKMIAGDFGVAFDWKNPTVLRKRDTGKEPAAGDKEGAANPENAIEPDKATAADGDTAPEKPE